MLLSELEPTFVKILEPNRLHQVEGVSFAEADGVQFLCPVCFRANNGPIGTHQICCWRPHVPLTESPGPGRWEFAGSGLHDLSLVAGSSSIHLTGPGCGAHFHITGGQIPEVP